jgi:hypothetical protein
VIRRLPDERDPVSVDSDVERRLREEFSRPYPTKSDPLAQRKLSGIESAIGRLRGADALLGKRLEELDGRLHPVLGVEPENAQQGANDTSSPVPLQDQLERLARSIELRSAHVESLLRRLAL